MKKNILVIVLSLFYTGSFAQDYIIKKNGEEIYCRIKEVLPSFVTYIDTSSVDSMLRSITKNEILFIKYSNGLKEMFTEDAKKEELVMNKSSTSNAISSANAMKGPIVNLGSNDFSIEGHPYTFKAMKKELRSIDNPEIEKCLKQAKISGLIGNTVAYSSIPIGYIGFSLGVLSVQLNDPAVAFAGAVFGVICISENVANIMLKLNKRKQIDSAIEIYNQRYYEEHPPLKQ